MIDSDFTRQSDGWFSDFDDLPSRQLSLTRESASIFDVLAEPKCEVVRARIEKRAGPNVGVQIYVHEGLGGAVWVENLSSDYAWSDTLLFPHHAAMFSSRSALDIDLLCEAQVLAWSEPFVSFQSEKAAQRSVSPRWLIEVQTGPNANVSDQQLSGLMDGIWDLVESRKFNDLNEALLSAKLPLMPQIVIAGVLRYTFSVRNKIDSWRSLLDEAQKELRRRHVDVERVLSGLDGN